MNRSLKTILALTLVLLMAATAAQAADCTSDTADTDKDGLSDLLECTTGITLLGGETVPPCPGTGPHGCVHPDVPDLFIVIVRASPSLLPTTDLLEFFDIVTGHEIHEGDVGTLLEIPGTTPVQRALKITENTTAGAGGGYLGELPWGVPPNITIGTIYTQDIANYVYSKGGNDAHAATYMKYVLAHEFGHGMKLAPKYNSRYNGYHYSIKTDVVMQENAVVSTKGGSAPTFYFPADWGVDSEAAYKLK